MGEKNVVNPFGGEDEAIEPSDGDVEAKPFSDGTIFVNSNSLPYPILDSLAVKRRAIKHPMEAAVLVLTIDSGIMRGQARQGNWGINTYLDALLGHPSGF